MAIQHTGQKFLMKPSAGGQQSSDVLSALALQIVMSPKIVLAKAHVSTPKDGADPHSEAVSTLLEVLAKRSSTSDKPGVRPPAPGGRIALDVRMLRSLLELSKYYSFTVSEMAGGCHDGRAHYAGHAFDVTFLNGIIVSASNPVWKQFKADCQQMGAAKVFGPGDAGHKGHVHAEWA